MFYCVSCGSFDTFPKEKSDGLGEPSALKKLIESGQTVENGDYRIVDVRTEKKYTKGYIPTAMNLPNGNLDTMKMPPPKDKLIIMYCENGERSEMAAEKMAKAGYNQIYNWGAFENWTFLPER
jgi:rhodanese-related sulfurtransferase